MHLVSRQVHILNGRELPLRTYGFRRLSGFWKPTPLAMPSSRSRPYSVMDIGEDENGFEAIAQRSMLADANKDSGAVSMFPPMADEWVPVNSVYKTVGKPFNRRDFHQLRTDYGVNWVVLQQPGIGGPRLSLAWNALQ